MKYFKVLFIMGALLRLLSFDSFGQNGELKMLTVGDFQHEILKIGVQLLDVRTLVEFNQGHIPNAMLADWREKDEFVRRIESLSKSEPLYIYCLSGNRSSAAANFLLEQGFSEIIELEGGISAWKNGNKALENEMTVETLSSESYNDILNLNEFVLVDFGASWCPPCRKMAPIIDSLKVQYSNIHIVEVDGEVESSLMKLNQVIHMPTYILYREGVEVWRESGVIEKDAFEAILRKYFIYR